MARKFEWDDIIFKISVKINVEFRVTANAIKSKFDINASSHKNVFKIFNYKDPR